MQPWDSCVEGEREDDEEYLPITRAGGRAGWVAVAGETPLDLTLETPDESLLPRGWPALDTIT
jgi:hypothetical protein